MHQQEEIDVFQDLLKEPKNILVEKALEEGRAPIGYTCSYVPDVLLSVDRLFPVRVRAPGVGGTEMADTYLSSVICSYTRSLLEYAMEGQYDFLQGWIFTASCDHLRRLYDNIDYLQRPFLNHIIDVPHKVSDASMQWLREELSILREKLSRHFEISITDERISTAIRQKNRFNMLLKSIGDERKKDIPAITGTVFHRMMMSSQVAPCDMVLPYLNEYIEKGAAHDAAAGRRARIMLMGGEMDDPAYTGIIESQGALVVADRFCTGSLPGLEPISEEGDPIEALAEHSFKSTMCPRMMADFPSRVERVLELVQEYRVDGIIIEMIKFCDTWGVESSTMVAALRKAGVPVLKLEREYRLTGEGQLRTRVQAFLESMGK